MVQVVFLIFSSLWKVKSLQLIADCDGVLCLRVGICKFRNFNSIKLLQTLILAESGIAALDSDPSAELSRFHIRLSSLAIVLLHEDILTLVVESDGSSLARSSVQDMKAISKAFFDELGLFAVAGYGSKDFQGAKEAFLKACQLNHIRHVFSQD
jgi:hypothetical protein